MADVVGVFCTVIGQGGGLGPLATGQCASK